MASTIYDYKYCHRFLRDGYVYVYNETARTISEYQAKEGKYYVVLKNIEKVLSDDRPAELKSVNYFIIEAQNAVLWLAFSHVQWSAKYIKKYIKDSGFRSIRGQQYDTKKYSANDARYISLVNVYFSPPTESEKSEMADPDSQLRKEYRFCEMMAYESWQKVKQATESMPAALQKFMVTFTLHDSVGCADDACDEYARLVEYHTALTRGLSYAKTPEEMLANKNNPYFITPHDPHNLQFHALHESASFINELILKNNANNHNYGYVFNREWIRKVLAIDEREKLYSQMLKAHMVLGWILSSNYYQNEPSIFIRTQESEQST